jgi:hypothetical protein
MELPPPPFSLGAYPEISHPEKQRLFVIMVATVRQRVQGLMGIPPMHWTRDHDAALAGEQWQTESLFRYADDFQIDRSPATVLRTSIDQHIEYRSRHN